MCVDPDRKSPLSIWHDEASLVVTEDESWWFSLSNVLHEKQHPSSNPAYRHLFIDVSGAYCASAWLDQQRRSALVLDLNTDSQGFI